MNPETTIANTQVSLVQSLQQKLQAAMMNGDHAAMLCYSETLANALEGLAQISLAHQAALCGAIFGDEACE